MDHVPEKFARFMIEMVITDMVITNMDGKLVDVPFDTLKNIDLIDFSFHRYYFEDVKLEKSQIKKCDFSGSNLNCKQMIDGRFEDCTFCK